MNIIRKIARALGRRTNGPSVAAINGDFSLFEQWIKEAVGGPYIWRIRPRDDRENRIAVADSILQAIEGNNGVFPHHNTFIEVINDLAEPTEARSNRGFRVPAEDLG